eukprot:8586888-Lingulodinium_polyedra.AAC.1
MQIRPGPVPRKHCMPATLMRPGRSFSAPGRAISEGCDFPERGFERAVGCDPSRRVLRRKDLPGPSR